jgi:hypothetical protein
MKKKIIIFILFFLSLSTVFADYNNFVNELESMNLNVKSVSLQHYVSRYDLSKYVSAVTCNDCMIPNQDYLNKFNMDWRISFKNIP